MIRVVRCREDWDAAGGEVIRGDLYYQWEFLSTWAREEAAEPLGLLYECDFGRVVYPVLSVPLDELAGGEGKHDLRTAYDFGGPLASGDDPARALVQFEEELERFALRTGVVSEFARLHPLRLENLPSGAAWHADNYVVDLRLGERGIAVRQHPRHQRAVRAAAKHEPDFELVARPGTALVETWTALYTSTMQRLGAPPAYHFSDRLFHELLALEGVRLATVFRDRDPLAMAIVVASRDDLLYYLGASSEAGRAVRANNFLMARVISAAVAEGLRTYHLGGGSPSLRAFKEQIATGTVPYRLLRRVYSPEVYAHLAAPIGNTGDFPAYRSRLERAHPAR